MNIPLAMINGFGQMALVVVFFGMIKRLELSRCTEQLALGVLFGLGSVLAMMSPAHIIPGVIVDTRAIAIGLAGAFVGPVAAVVAGLMAGACRLWIGGTGTEVGLASILVAVASGILWRAFWPKARKATLGGLADLGGLMALHAMPALLFLLWLGSSPPGFFEYYFPTSAATCLAAAVSLGWMIQREVRLLSREKALTRFAFADPLTGLANRRSFNRRLSAPDFAMEGKNFALLILDVDHFKSINDRLGHDGGDAVLSSLGTALSQAMRDGDFVARYGGEEFVILLPSTTLVESLAIAERLRRMVSGLVVPGLAAPLDLTASFGVATSARYDDHRTLIAAADLALYKAKENGRNRVETATLSPPALSIVA